MYLWNSDGLAKEFKERTVSEKEKYKYYMFACILYLILFDFLFYLGPADKLSTLTLLSSIISLSITIYGIYRCYDINSKGDGLFFIERMVCLEIPITIKYLTYFAFSMFIIAIILGGDNEGTNFLYWFISEIGSYIFLIAVYYKLYNHLKLVSGADSGITNS